ncbi:MAG: cation transporter, partial [Trueperaceae bacterium]
MTTESIELRRLLPGHQPSEDACTDLISAALTALEGVLAARFVASGGARFEVDYDPRRVDPGAIGRLADEAGEAARQRYAHERLRIQGIHCADCADKISAVTGKLAGVSSSVASYASELLDVSYDRTAVRRERIEREVESLGYKV